MTPLPVRPSNSWLMNQPYLLLCLTSLFWAGNIVVGRYAAGQIPPMALSFIRWAGAFVIVLPFAWRQTVRDWPLIRRHWMMMVLLSFIGVATFNTLGYWSLQYTQALNALLLQSSGPLYVALFSLLLFGIRLTWAQTFGIAISLTGVLIILLRGDLTTLLSIQLNKGDVGYTIALVVFGVYSAMAARRPPIQPISFLLFTCGCGSLFVAPLFIWEMCSGRTTPINATTIPVLVYIAIFPSALAYLFFNRGVELIGANRAAPFFHLMPAFGSVMAIGFLGERFQLFHLAGYVLVLAGVIVAARRASASGA
ncbi:MAG TPA: DMT family transporter [Afipia sp.]